MAAALSFEDRYGRAGDVAVDYHGTRLLAPNVLPNPLESDTLEEMAHKMRDIATVIEQGGSVAVATGFKTATHLERDPEKIAAMTMTETQKEQYESWKAGTSLPTINWATDTRKVPEENAEKYEKHAAAMRIMYGYEGVTAEHACWVTCNMEYTLPLIFAITKVEEARQKVAKNPDALKEMDKAEIHVAHTVHAIASKKVNDVFSQLRLLTKDIEQSKKIIQVREKALKAGTEGQHKRTKSSIANVRVKTEGSDDGPQRTHLAQDTDDGGNADGRKRRCLNPPAASTGEELNMSRAVEVEDDEAPRASVGTLKIENEQEIKGE